MLAGQSTAAADWPPPQCWQPGPPIVSWYRWHLVTQLRLTALSLSMATQAMPLETNSHTVAVLALNSHDITARCVERVRASGFDGPLVLLDNGSQPPLADVAATSGCVFIRNETNRFVNPAWNQLFDLCTTRYLTLLNNDCLVRDGYLQEVTAIMAEAGLALATPAGVRVANILDVVDGLGPETDPPVIDRAAVRNGEVMTLDMHAYRRCRYRIPSRLRIWYGDDWIWGQLRLHGYVCGRITNRTSIRETSRTIKANPDLKKILDHDSRIAFNSPLFARLRVLAGVAPGSIEDAWSGGIDSVGWIRSRIGQLRDWVLLRD